jgi:hypothetical protein
MAILDILSAAQGGKYFVNAGQAAGLSESDARTAVAALAPAIAEKLKDKAAADPDAFDQLLDLLEEGGDSSDLDDADAMTGGEALKDGGAVLDDLYGSREQAMTAMAKLAPHAKGKVLEAISAISATSVLASLAATNANTLAATDGNAGASGGGILSVIIAALMKGLMQGVRRQVAPRRRRRRNYGYYYGRRPPRRRRTRRPGLDDIFRSVLNSRR